MNKDVPNKCREASNFDGKKILITGGLGFIGSNLAIKCVALGGEVTIYDLLDTHSGGNMESIRDIADRVVLCRKNILDFKALQGAVEGKDFIINCAAATSHTHSMEKPWTDIDVNVRGTVNLLEAVRSVNLDAKVIHLGTTTQFGRLQYQPADENHPEFPTDISSANKCVSEKYMFIYGRTYGIRVCVLRLPNVYGPRAGIHSPHFTFNNYFIGRALKNESILIFGKGDQKRNLIFVDDVVGAIVRTAFEDKADGEVFLVAGDQHYTVNEIAATIVAIFKSGRVQHIEWPEGRKAIEVGNAIISNSKIKDTMHWKPVVGLEEGLEKTRRFYAATLRHYLR